MNTVEKLVEMLKENTGRHILDSGGHYGRHWERNQEIDFEKQPEGQLEFHNRNGELDILATLSIYHFLKERLEYNEELDNYYREFTERDDGCYYFDLKSAQDFANSINGKGIYGDDSGPVVVNTYNGEDLLSQTIQYVYWTDEEGDAHILLQIHGGCDVRGGYTYPVVFDVIDYDGTSIFDNSRATIYCNDCDKYWDSDNGCHWLEEHSGRERRELQDYGATDEKPNYPERINLNQLSLPVDLPKRPEPSADVIWVDEDKNGHCPYCSGLLRLAAWFVS